MLSSEAEFLLFSCFSTFFLRNNDHIILISGLHKEGFILKIINVYDLVCLNMVFLLRLVYFEFIYHHGLSVVF